MFALQELLELLLVPIFDVALSTQTHQVFNEIFVIWSAHLPCFNVVQILTNFSAHFTIYEWADVVSKVVHINLSVFLHLVNSNDQDVGSEIARSNLNPQFSNSWTHSSWLLMFICPHFSSKSVLWGVLEKWKYLHFKLVRKGMSFSSGICSITSIDATKSNVFHCWVVKSLMNTWRVELSFLVILRVTYSPCILDRST